MSNSSQAFFLLTLNFHMPRYWLLRKMRISRETKIPCHQEELTSTHTTKCVTEPGSKVSDMTVLDELSPS